MEEHGEVYEDYYEEEQRGSVIEDLVKQGVVEQVRDGSLILKPPDEPSVADNMQSEEVPSPEKESVHKSGEYQHLVTGLNTT